MIWSFAMIAGLLLYMMDPRGHAERRVVKTSQDARRTLQNKTQSTVKLPDAAVILAAAQRWS